MYYYINNFTRSEIIETTQFQVIRNRLPASSLTATCDWFCSLLETGKTALEAFRQPLPTASRLLYSTIRILTAGPDTLMEMGVQGIRLLNNALKLAKLTVAIDKEKEKKLTVIYLLATIFELGINLKSCLHQYRAAHQAENRKWQLYHTSLSIASLAFACSNLYFLIRHSQNLYFL